MSSHEQMATGRESPCAADWLALLLNTSFRPASAEPEDLKAAFSRACVFLVRLLCAVPGRSSALDGFGVGVLYERLLGWDAQAGPHGEVLLVPTKRARKASGIYYTPRRIVDAIVESTLGPLTARAGASASALRGGAPLDELLRAFLALRVVDPAMGCGSFLLSAADHIARAMRAEPRISAALNLNACRALAAESCLFGMDLDAAAVQLAETALVRHCGRRLQLEGQFRVGDSLRDTWDASPAFDAVVGNPPWVSFSGRQAERLPAADRSYYAEHFEGFRGWLSTQGLFIEQALRLCRPGGRVGLVAPAQIADLDGYAPLRRAVTSSSQLAVPVRRLGEDEFEGVNEPSAIYVLERFAESKGEGSGAVWEWRGPVCTLAYTILEKMRRFPPLPKETFGDPGVHSGNSAALILTRGMVARPDWAPVREGKDIARFHLGPPRRSVWTRPDLPEGRYCRVRPLERYETARILIRQTASRPVAARHVSPTYFRNSVLACAGVPWLADEVLLAILNSHLIAFYHRHSFADSLHRSFPQVKVSHLRAIPVPRDIPPEASGELTELVRTAESEETRPGALAHVDARLDRIIYGLFGLTKAEIDTVQAEQPDRF